MENKSNVELEKTPSQKIEDCIEFLKKTKISEVEGGNTTAVMRGNKATADVNDLVKQYSQALERDMEILARGAEIAEGIKFKPTNTGRKG